MYSLTFFFNNNNKYLRFLDALKNLAYTRFLTTFRKV